MLLVLQHRGDGGEAGGESFRSSGSDPYLCEVVETYGLDAFGLN